MDTLDKFPPQLAVRATYMRGGTSKGVFFNNGDLPAGAQHPGAERDALLQRIIGSPDPYEKQIDGMGGGTPLTSKVAIVDRSVRANADIDYIGAGDTAVSGKKGWYSKFLETVSPI